MEVVFAMQWVCSFTSPFFHHLDGAPSITVCNASLGLFSNSSIFKDNNLFWSYPGLCHCTTVKYYVAKCAIKKLANRLDGDLWKKWFSLGHSAAGGRWGGITFLQTPWLPFRLPKENGQTWLPCLSPLPPPVLFSGNRVIFSNTESENCIWKQMHLFFQEGLDSASTCTLKQSLWTSEHLG